MTKRYFRKKAPASTGDTVEWVEMSGREYYRFVTDAMNKGRYFHDMGDVVLECTEAEYKKFKAEDDHSSYLLEQEYGLTILSLDVLNQQETLDADGFVDTSQNVEETAICNLLRQDLHRALQCLPEQDYWLIYALFLSEPQKTIRQLSAESGVPVMTLQDRKQKIVSTLRTQLLPQKSFPKKRKKLRTNLKKVRNREV